MVLDTAGLLDVAALDRTKIHFGGLIWLQKTSIMKDWDCFMGKLKKSDKFIKLS